MNSPASEPSKSTSIRARAEAAAWLAKLHGESRDTAIESGWRQWIAESPEHVRAWELATEAWSETDDLPSMLPRRSIPNSAMMLGRGFRRPLVAVLATSLVLAGVALYYFVEKSAVTTAIGEQRSLNLADGTRVELNTNSHLAVQYNDHVRTVVLRSGEAYFNVAHERRPFVVVAGSRKVIAVGTSFVVRRDEVADNSITVTLIEGRVAVAPLGEPDALPPKPNPGVTLLSAGKRLRAGQHSLPTVDTPSVDRETAWMRGQLIFDGTPLREAAAEFNRYNAVQIKVRSNESGEIAVGGVFRIGDSASFAAAVAQAHDLRLTTKGHELILESLDDGESERIAPSDR